MVHETMKEAKTELKNAAVHQNLASRYPVLYNEIGGTGISMSAYKIEPV